MSMSGVLVMLVSLSLVVSGTSYKVSDDGEKNETNKVTFDGKYPSGKDDITRRKRADDVDLAAVIQQQAATIQQLQSQLTATQNEVTALKNSLPSSFSPVGFSVRFNADNVDDGISLGAHSTLKFDHVVTNLGNGYDPRDGEFTAPVAGLYAFFLNVMSTNRHGDIWIAIVKNDSPLDVVWAEGSGDVYDQGTGQVTAHLQVGDQVWVRQNGGDAVRGAWYTIFTGYLVQAD